MLSISQLTIKQGQRQILTVNNASVAPGEMVSIVGANGAGKSSLLKTLASEWSHSMGEIRFGNNLLEQWPRKQRAKHIGVLPQSSQLTFPFRASEVVAIGATPLNLSQKQLSEQVLHWMSVTNTQHLVDREYLSLSGGERQRVQLARVLLQLSQAEFTPLLGVLRPSPRN